jgi:glycosyltransferase involved in cell wall biosynthesis
MEFLMVEFKSVMLIVDGFGEGGVQQAYIRLINEYKLLFSKVYLVVLQATEKDLPFISKDNCQVFKLNSPKLIDCQNFKRFMNIVRTASPQFMIASIYRSQIWSALVKGSATKLIWVEHNTYINRKGSQWLLMRILSRRVDKIVGVSDDVKKITENKLKTQVITIPNPYTLLPSIRLNLVRKNDFVYISRMTNQKNPEFAIKCFASFCLQSSINAKLHLVGDGYLLENLRSLVEYLGIEKQCIFYGRVENTRIDKILKSSKTLISTSIIEGMPLVRIEALISGCCVVTTNTGGTHFFNNLQNSGFFVSDGTLNNFVELMEKSLNPKYWTKSMVIKRSSISSLFEPRRISERLIKF